MPLQAGDMCVVIAPSGIPILNSERWILGRTVVLLDHNCRQDGIWPPYWRCTDVGKASGVAEIALRKIDPPKLEAVDVFNQIADAITEMEPEETHDVT